MQGRCAALGHAPQHLRHLGVLQHMAHGPRLAVALVEVRCRHRVLAQRSLLRQQAVQPLRDRKTFLRQIDGRCDQLGPRQASLLSMRHLQHAHHPWHAHGAATHHCLRQPHGLAVHHEQIFGGFGRRGFTAIPGLHALAIVVQQKSPTAQAAGLRLHQRQHHLNGDGGVKCSAAFAQDAQPRLAGQRVRTGHGALGKFPTRLGPKATGCFRCVHGPCRAGQAQARQPGDDPARQHGRAYFGAIRMAPSKRMTSPFSMSFSKMCCARRA